MAIRVPLQLRGRLTSFLELWQCRQGLLERHAALLQQIQSKNERLAAYYYKQEIGHLDAETREFSPYLCGTFLEFGKMGRNGLEVFTFHEKTG